MTWHRSDPALAHLARALYYGDDYTLSITEGVWWLRGPHLPPKSRHGTVGGLCFASSIPIPDAADLEWVMSVTP